MWPVYLAAREQGRDSPYSTEFQTSSLSLFSVTESDDCRVYGIIQYNLLGYHTDDAVDAFSVYPLWWPKYPTVAIRKGESDKRGLLVDIDGGELKGFRFLNIYYRRGQGHGIFPLYGIHKDSWFWPRIDTGIGGMELHVFERYSCKSMED